MELAVEVGLLVVCTGSAPFFFISTSKLTGPVVSVGSVGSVVFDFGSVSIVQV